MSLQSLDRVLSKTADRSVGDIVATYGSNVQKLKMDAAAGKIDPTKAVMAMMAIQRIVAANTQPPPGTTVAQDTGIAPPPQPMMPPPAAPQQPPMRMAYGGQVAVSNNQVPSPAMERGIAGIPVPDNMFDYAGGGMVAFADGGNVQRFQTGKPVRVVGPNEPRLGGFTWDQLPTEDSGLYGPMVRGLYEAFMPASSERKKRDPITGEMLSFSQFLEKASQPQAQKTETEKDLPNIEKDKKGRLSVAEFYKNIPPDAQRYFDLASERRLGVPNVEAVDAAVEAAKKNKPTEAPAAMPTAPRQEERRGPALSSTPSNLSPTIPALPSVGSGQTGDFAVSPEDRARTLVDESGLPKVETLSDEQALQRIKDIEAKSGVDPDFFKKVQGRIDTMREEAKTDKKEAANLRIIEAGLGILGGTSPYAFVNIGKGAAEAVKGFGQDLKEYQKARRELDKAEMDLQSAEQNAARTKSSTAINLVERRQEQVNAAKTKEAELYTNAVKGFADLDEKAKSRISGENITMAGLQARREETLAQLQASRDETLARIAQSDRQIAESRAARLEAAGIAADQRFLDGLTKAENNATKSYDAQIETIQKALSNPAAAITPDFVKEQKAEINNLLRQKATAARLAREQYIRTATTGRPTQNNASLSAADRIAGIRR